MVDRGLGRDVEMEDSIRLHIVFKNRFNDCIDLLIDDDRDDFMKRDGCFTRIKLSGYPMSAELNISA